MKYRLQSVCNHVVGRAASVLSPFYFILGLEGELNVSGDGLNPVYEHSYASPDRRPPSSRDHSRPGNFIIRYLNKPSIISF